MKKSVDILGLAVISLTEGKELGTIKDIVINPVGGSIAALIVDDGKWYLGAKLLPFAAISGLGEYAITIENSANIINVSAAPELESLLISDVKVIGTKALTKAGRIQGKVTEIIIDNDGKIATCEIEETNGEITQLSAQRVMTFGKEVLIVTEANDEPAVTAAATLRTTEVPVTPSVTNPVITPVSPTVQDATQPKENVQDETARKFDEKHRKFLLGKKASRRIETDNGMVIVEQGGEITEEVLQKAKLAGKFVELSMSIQ